MGKKVSVFCDKCCKSFLLSITNFIQLQIARQNKNMMALYDDHLVSTNERIIFLMDTYSEMFTEWTDEKSRIAAAVECKFVRVIES
jgi:hypothetical protein